MTAVGTPAVDVDCGTPPRWRRRRNRPLTPEGVQRGGPHAVRGPPSAASRFIPLLVGRGLGAQAPGPLAMLSRSVPDRLSVRAPRERPGHRVLSVDPGHPWGSFLRSSMIASPFNAARAPRSSRSVVHRGHPCPDFQKSRFEQVSTARFEAVFSVASIRVHLRTVLLFQPAALRMAVMVCL